jgi:hypothetical protein
VCHTLSPRAGFFLVEVERHETESRTIRVLLVHEEIDIEVDKDEATRNTKVAPDVKDFQG